MPNWTQLAKFGVHHVRDFAFSDAKRLDVNLAFRTLGKRTANDDNVVLMLHGTTGSGAQFLQPESADALFAPGQPLDVERYFTILPDAIGHGGSSKPSDSLGEAFPRYGYVDMVEAQYRLLVEALDVKHLRLVIGTSMGGMQTWLWGERYPDMMDALMPIACFPERLSGRNVLFRRLMIDLIRCDPDYPGSAQNRRLSNLGAAWVLFQLMAGGARHFAEVLPNAAAADQYLRRISLQAIENEHPVDVIYEFDASYDYDPRPFLRRIKAPLLAVNFADDMINPVELGGLEDSIKEVARGRAITLPAGPGSIGHQTLRNAAAWCSHLAELLRHTESSV